MLTSTKRNEEIRVNEEKEIARKSMQLSLSKIDEQEREEISKQIQNHLFQSNVWRDAQTIGVHLSMEIEWDTREIVKRAFEEGRRSEEHTSELQSRGHLVCRLLLEKKNMNSAISIVSSYKTLL